MKFRFNKLENTICSSKANLNSDLASATFATSWIRHWKLHNWKKCHIALTWVNNWFIIRGWFDPTSIGSFHVTSVWRKIIQKFFSLNHSEKPNNPELKVDNLIHQIIMYFHSKLKFFLCLAKYYLKSAFLSPWNY